MKETVLLYQMEKERVGAVRKALLPLGIRVKVVEEKEYGQPVGYLAGAREVLESPQPAEAPFVMEQEMMVMAWLSGGQVDQVLAALRRQGVGRINYKAVLTPHNLTWDGYTLYEELKKEHAMFEANQ